jgi:hypothetical protein
MQARGQILDVTSDANGEFVLVLDDVPSGSLMFDTLAQPRLIVRGARLKPSEELDLRIPPGLGDSEVEGVVLSQDRRPVRGAKLSVIWNQRQAPLMCELAFEATTGARGKLALGNLGHGSYRVLIAAAGFPPFADTFELSDGESKKDAVFMLENAKD